MPDVTIQDVMKEYADAAVKHAKEHRIKLDYSEESLEKVDDILAKLTRGTVLEVGSEEEQENLWMVSKMYGGYVGEVVIRSMGGQWETEDLDSGSSKVVLDVQGVKGSPPEKVYKRLTEELHSGLAGYCQALRAILGTHT